MHLPGLILLVPGSIGMRSLSALVGQDVISGIETGFLAIMIAVALATGLILASALVPPRTSSVNPKTASTTRIYTDC